MTTSQVASGSHQPALLSTRNFLPALFCLLLLIGCGSSKPAFDALPANANVLILGDSLSYGTGAASGEDYPSLLAASTGWQIINAGKPGDTTAGGLERLPDLLAAQHVDLLIIELGGNDFLRHVPAQQTSSNLKHMLAIARASNVPTLLLGIPQFSPLGAAIGKLSDHTLYRKLAEETNTPLVEGIFSSVLANNALKSDPIHPNAEGYRIIAGKMHEALRKHGLAAR